MLRIHRITHAVELSLLILVAAIADAVRGDLIATRVLVRRLPGRGSRDGGRAPGGHHGVEAAALKLSCVILTMGNRPAELDRAIASATALRERPRAAEVVVVGNGADVGPVPDGVMTLRLEENLGVAGGRNAGVRACAGDVVLFLDDDGWYPDAGPGRARREPVRGRTGAGRALVPGRRP